MDNDDAVWWLYQPFFHKRPVVYRVTKWFEWFYIPAHELIMHGIMALTSFVIPHRRGTLRPLAGSTDDQEPG